MVQFNFSERTIKAKVVYYGPAQSGKTTNLEQIHRLSDPEGLNRLISLNTAQDRTLFFDLLPFSIGAVAGYDFKVQLYTVPGQVQYNATRRVVLAGADAVVFVADARRAVAKENQAAFENMKVNLLANRLVPEKVPLVLQYNKQDLPDLVPEAELTKILNPWNRRAFPAVAAQGEGVMETFLAVVQEMLTAIAIKYNLKEKGLDPALVPQVVEQAFGEVLRQAAGIPGEARLAAESDRDTGEPAAGSKVVVSQYTDSLHAAPPPSGSETGLVSEELLHRSIRANVELAESLAGLVRDVNLGLGAILSHAELLSGYREDQKDKRLIAIGSIQGEAMRLRRIIKTLGAVGGEEGAVSGSSPATPAPSARAAAPPAPEAGYGNGDFESVLNEVLASARRTIDAHHISVHMRIPAGPEPPTCPPLALHRALAGAVEALASGAVPGSQLSVRCERKPVLLRSKEGEIKRDFLMLALAHDGQLSAEDQQRIVQGIDSGPLGQASRQFREMGGFVRFAPLAGGALETRVFLPTGG